jgi:hypothetical protein
MQHTAMLVNPSEERATNLELQHKKISEFFRQSARKAKEPIPFL